MTSASRNTRALRAIPVLLLAILMAGAGAAPAALTPKEIDRAAGDQVLAAATAGATAAATSAPTPWASAASVDAPALAAGDGPDRRIAEYTANAIAESFAEARQAARAEARAQARAEARAQARAEAAAEARAAAPTYSGTNHFWIPSLGMSDDVRLFPCSRSRPPDNYLYRWGCAGQNNVYLLGHAYSVMKPLHDLYVSGGLRKGMVAIYANGAGHVTKYKVVSWRVVDPVDSAWAIADQPVPSMTLQTCVGKKSQWRLNVRLVAVG